MWLECGLLRKKVSITESIQACHRQSQDSGRGLLESELHKPVSASVPYCVVIEPDKIPKEVLRAHTSGCPVAQQEPSEQLFRALVTHEGIWQLTSALTPFWVVPVEHHTQWFCFRYTLFGKQKASGLADLLGISSVQHSGCGPQS